MTSHDLRDVLNLPSDNSAGPRSSKKQKLSVQRPNLKGLAREVQNLGGDNPIAIVPAVSIFKKRRFASRKPAARWGLKPFTNSARDDDGALVLRHWRRKTDDGPPHDHMEDGETMPTENTANGESDFERPEDSSFAKYNVHVAVPQYSDDQYYSNLQSDDWTKEETDYLLSLVKDFDLRWTIIWDRYEYSPKHPEGTFVNGDSTAVVSAPNPRTMEDLKARYYEVASKMMAVQKPAQYMTTPEFDLYEIMQKFKPESEKARKKFATETMARSKDEAREEESLLAEIRRIVMRTETFNEQRRELYNRLDYPATDSDINNFKSSAGLQALLQNLMNVDKSKKRKSIMGPGEGVSPSTAVVPGSAVSETAPPNRRESIAATAPSQRDSTAGTPATPVEPPPPSTASKKKGAPPPVRRELTEQEEQIYGVTHHERLGSGPTFRYEKINKLYSHKSGQQQLRITNALAELDIPARLAMPTAAVTGQFEILWSAVTALVDLRKISDRLDGEIKIEEAKKAERDKARAAAGGDSSGQKPASDVEKAGKSGEKPAGGEAPTRPEGSRAETKAPGDSAAEATDKAAAAAAAVSSPAEIKEEQGGEKDKLGPTPGSSGTQKRRRSPSVMSAASDKSAKRQKK
ncbi:hypothetical protein B0T22DRAFT_470390 [Podospora appendiculata]|uniref:SWR1-complex protein 4 n=1 Tax=Podospora appendiculata TaxID=314037 RepID=A0AAE0X0P4_9PEZI|nr:hypothetical protein B0T22DRAFT_470390 [Podospora appendiculata]